MIYFHFLPLFDFPGTQDIILETILQQPSPSSSQRELFKLTNTQCPRAECRPSPQRPAHTSPAFLLP